MYSGKTKSVCPVCLRVLDAVKIERDDGIYMEKSCPEHGDFSALIWEGDASSYLAWDRENVAVEPPVDGKKPEKGCPYDCGLCTEHLRKGCCVLLELTSRCNLGCPVCFASAGERESREPDLEEIGKQYDYLMAHGGPFNIQLSGGEPTVRDDLPEIIRLGGEKGLTFFQLNTNGIRLAEEQGYAERLKKAGLDTVFLQFDGLNDEVYRTLRGRALLDIKLRAVENCIRAGLGTVLVPVIAAGVNEDQVGDIIRYAESKMPGVRGVHFQPLSRFGRCELPGAERPVTIPRMLRLIEEQTGGKMKYSDFSGGGAENAYCSFHASYRRQSEVKLKCLPRRSGCCCTGSDDSRTSVAEQWTGAAKGYGESAMTETSSLDEFLRITREKTLAISGMVFQDAWNLELDRLRRCHICELDGDFGMVPFCAYNLTDTQGRSMYRK